MRSVLVVSHTGGLWGAQLRLTELAPRLVQFGYRLVLAAPGGGRFEDAWRSLDLPFLPLDVRPLEGLRRTDGRRRSPVRAVARDAATAASSAARLARLARGFDLLQSHSLSAHPEVALAGRLGRTPAVLDVHDIVAPGAGRRVLRAAVVLARGTMVNSRATAATVGEVGRRGIEVVYPGVDPERFRPGPPLPGAREGLGGEEGSVLVGVLGRVDPLKQVELVVEAMAGLPPVARLVVVGDAHRAPSGYGERLQAMARERLGGRVVFAGTRDDVPAVLRSLDVVVSASRIESFGRSVLEAQACGLPVVVPRVGGLVEVVDDRSTGFVVPPGDVEALREALGRLVADPQLRRSMGELGVRRVAEHFTFERQCAAVAQAYDHALAGSGRRSGGRVGAAPPLARTVP